MPVERHRHPELEQKIGQIKITSTTSTGLPSPLTAKGQIWVYGTSDQALDVGPDGYLLTADSSGPRGVSWQASTVATDPLTTKGDLHGFGAASARIPIGTSGQVLVPVSTSATQLEWRSRVSSPWTYGVTGDAQMQWSKGTDLWDLEMGDDADAFIPRMRFLSGNHATNADDILLFNSASAERYRWDDDQEQHKFNADIMPTADLSFGLGGAVLTFTGIHADSVFDRAGASVLDIQNAETDVAWKHNAEVTIDQASAAGAVEVLTLDQADIDQNFVKYIGTSSTATADQSLVNAAHFTTPGAVAGYIQISVQDDSGSTGALADTHYWMPIYATPTA